MKYTCTVGRYHIYFKPLVFNSNAKYFICADQKYLDIYDSRLMNQRTSLTFFSVEEQKRYIDSLLEVR